MKYIRTNSSTPTCSIISDSDIVIELVAFGYSNTDISNTAILSTIGYIAIDTDLPTAPNNSCIAVASKDQSNSWSVGWMLDTEYNAVKAAQVAGNVIRRDRNKLLATTDWSQGKDISDAVSAKWVTYRQALRDITLQEGFPNSVIWPTPPQ